jgi:hypothetical protein
MPWGLKRFHASGQTHFVTFCCYHRRPSFMEKLRYIHQNPVKRGLCARAEDWEWNSFRQYATGCAGRVEIECEWAARKRERAAGDSAQPQSPTQAKKRLEWATRPLLCVVKAWANPWR